MITPAGSTSRAGKSCFHIKKIDPDTEKETRILVKRGFDLYRDIESFV